MPPLPTEIRTCHPKPITAWIPINQQPVTEIVPVPDVTRPTLSAALQQKLAGGVISIGNFDGVHLGHRSLLRQTRELASNLSGPTIACLFEPHPIVLLRPDAAPKRLTTVAERARRMSSIGIDYLVVCQTSHAMLNLSAETFFHALVQETLNCRGMVEGADFCFGKNRGGDVNLLRSLCDREGIVFNVAEMESTDGQIISSTRIRDALAQGDVASASKMMSAPHRIHGVVSPGDGRGRTLGFPTANLSQIDVLVPSPAVYAGIATVQRSGGNNSSEDTDTDGGTVGEIDTYQAAIHIGPSPTFDSGSSAKVEVHLLDFTGNLYDRTISVDFVDQVRGVIKFDSADAIRNQLQHDILSTRQILSGYFKNPPGSSSK